MIPRSHPWNHAASNPTHRCYDFKSHPELIRTKLEDFLPLNKWSAIDHFYELLEWLNGSDSVLESNDCGTRGICPNTDSKYTKKLWCPARLMILYRYLPDNLLKETFTWLTKVFSYHLAILDTSFEYGIVRTTIVPTNYVTLPLPEQEQAGFQLELNFFCWGDDDVETMENLGRSFVNVHRALREVSRKITES